MFSSLDFFGQQKVGFQAYMLNIKHLHENGNTMSDSGGALRAGISVTYGSVGG